MKQWQRVKAGDSSSDDTILTATSWQPKQNHDSCSNIRFGCSARAEECTAVYDTLPQREDLSMLSHAILYDCKD